jgi:ABC-type multidrug transport system ATPase subunit
MRKRVGVARAIAHKPRYLLWDEPTTGLDPVNADNIDELIMELGRQLGVTSIVVTHDLDTAFEVGDRIALLYEGRVRAVPDAGRDPPERGSRRAAIRSTQPREDAVAWRTRREHGQAQTEPRAHRLLTIVATVIFFWGLFWMLGTPLFRGGMDVTVSC